MATNPALQNESPSLLRYVSTRGEAPELSFEDALLAGLARDGGLYVPETWPAVSPETIASFAGMPFPEVAVALLEPFVGRVDRALLGFGRRDGRIQIGRLERGPQRRR